MENGNILKNMDDMFLSVKDTNGDLQQLKQLAADKAKKYLVYD